MRMAQISRWPTPSNVIHKMSRRHRIDWLCDRPHLWSDLPDELENYTETHLKYLDSIIILMRDVRLFSRSAKVEDLRGSMTELIRSCKFLHGGLSK